MVEFQILTSYYHKMLVGYFWGAMTNKHNDTQHNNKYNVTLNITTLIIMQSIVMLSVIYAVCHVQGLYAESHYAESHYAEFHYAECHYVEFHFAECLLCRILQCCVSLCWILLCWGPLLMYQYMFLHSFLVKIGNSWPAEVAQWLEHSWRRINILNLFTHISFQALCGLLLYPFYNRLCLSRHQYGRRFWVDLLLGSLKGYIETHESLCW